MKIKLLLIGAGLYACVRSLSQDMVGKEGYLKIVEAGWIDPIFTVPLAIIALISLFGILPSGEVEEVKK